MYEKPASSGWSNRSLTLGVLALVAVIAGLGGVIYCQQIQIGSLKERATTNYGFTSEVNGIIRGHLSYGHHRSDRLSRPMPAYPLLVANPPASRDPLIDRWATMINEEPEGESEGNKEAEETIHVTFVSIYLVIDPSRLKPQPKPEEANQGVLLVASQGI
ncbi:MAG: hypothetical protein WC675_03565 [Patescibacteria group bacterium]|jgi:hypothetical protein